MDSLKIVTSSGFLFSLSSWMLSELFENISLDTISFNSSLIKSILHRLNFRSKKPSVVSIVLTHLSAM